MESNDSPETGGGGDIGHPRPPFGGPIGIKNTVSAVNQIIILLHSSSTLHIAYKDIYMRNGTVGQNIALHALAAARYSAPLICVFPVY